jgi:hypothetical protein
MLKLIAVIGAAFATAINKTAVNPIAPLRRPCWLSLFVDMHSTLSFHAGKFPTLLTWYCSLAGDLSHTVGTTLPETKPQNNEIEIVSPTFLVNKFSFLV